MFIIFSKNGGIVVNYCWNYESWKPLHFIEYRLDKRSNKHTKTTINATVHFFVFVFLVLFLIDTGEIKATKFK